MQKTNKDLLHSIRKGLGCAAACAAMALAASTLPTTAWAATDTSGDNTSTTVIGIESLKGKTLSELQSAAVKEGEYPTDDASRIFFLYNVKTKKFLNAGSFYGTHVSLKETPLSLWINGEEKGDSIDFAQNMTTGQGHLLRWCNNSGNDKGVFIDRTKEKNNYKWRLQSTSTSDALNTYKLYTYATNSTKDNNTKYYLCANGTTVGQDKNCEAFTTSDISKKNLSGYDEWRIFSMQQIYDLQDENTEKMTESIGLTFKLKCPGFSRGNNDITNWKTTEWVKKDNGGARFGLERMYNKQPKTQADGTDKYDVQDISDSNPYTFYNTAGKENSTKYTDLGTYKCNMAKYFCADAKNVHGTIYQEVEVKHSGSYVIECKGFSTTTEAKLFAVLFRANDLNTPVDKTLHESVLCQTSYMTSDELDTLHISEQNMDYAGRNFYSSHKYFNSVLVHVPEITDGGSNYVIRFGIAIGNDTDTDESVKDGEWTVFDDFRLLYASKTIDEDLILDEDRIDLNYLKCANNYKNKVLHLNKTFTRDKWNSFILPVNLTNDQFRMAFGGNARLAKLSKLTKTQVQFTTVNTDEAASGETVLEAYTPYIIFPTRYIAPNESPAYKALLTETEGQATRTTVIIKKNNIEIPNVSFAMDSENKNDLSKIDTTTWAVNTTEAHTVGGDGTMTAYGTLARTFDQNATQDTNESSDTYGEYIFSTDRETKGTIIDKRDNLIDSYFFWNGNFYYSDSRKRGLRGFSCWFKPTYPTGSTAKTTLFIDGVAQDSTADISDLISNGGEEPRGKAAEGVFSLSGQRISDAKDINSLPAGMYIVNGKKYVVK